MVKAFWKKTKKPSPQILPASESLPLLGDPVEGFSKPPMIFSGHIKTTPPGVSFKTTPPGVSFKDWMKDQDFLALGDYQGTYVEAPPVSDHNEYAFKDEIPLQYIVKKPTNWSTAAPENILQDIFAAQKKMHEAYQLKGYHHQYSIMDEIWGKPKPKIIDSRPDTESEEWD